MALRYSWLLILLVPVCYSQELNVLETDIRAYGQLWVDTGVDSITVTLTETDSFYTITGLQTGTYPVLNVTLTDSSITILKQGIYEVDLSISLSGSVAAIVLHCAVFVNDVKQNNMVFEQRINTTTDVSSVSCSGILQLEAGDILKAKISRETASGNAEYKHLNFMVHKQ